MKILWKLPVPTGALLGDGPIFEERPRRVVAVRVSHETDEGQDDLAVVFDGVEAFRVTHYHARSSWMRSAYEQLIDLEQTAWLEEIKANLEAYKEEGTTLRHLAINFDDGPCVEVICRSFLVEKSSR